MYMTFDFLTFRLVKRHLFGDHRRAVDVLDILCKVSEHLFSQ